MLSWQTIQTLLIFFGPWLVPKILSSYRSLKNAPQSQIKPLPTRTSYALALLFVSACIALLSTLPLFAPENIFRLTHSRLTTSTGVLLARLAALRPLKRQDEKLRSVLESGGLEARLLYARFGPDVLINNPLAQPGDLDAARNFLIATAPALLTPHLFHLAALGIATSGTLAGKHAARWRPLAIIPALILAAAESWYIATYDDRPNAGSVRVNDIDFLHWKLRVYRGLGIALFDAGLGWLLWLQATGRAFPVPPTAAERFATHSAQLERVLGRARGVGVLRNGTVRDAEMRRRVEGYWVKEGEVMKDVLEEPEVLEAQRSALTRLDMTRVGRDAEQFVEGILMAGAGDGVGGSAAPS